jgi:hypothetical protein
VVIAFSLEELFVMALLSKDILRVCHESSVPTAVRWHRHSFIGNDRERLEGIPAMSGQERGDPGYPEIRREVTSFS